MKYFEAIKTLFSRSRAFQLFIDNNKRKLVKGLSFLPEAVRHEAELVYFDLFPDTTRFPEKWEKVFAVFFTEEELEKRRDVLDSLWKINKGGQSAVFLQDILQKIDNTINVFENIPLRNPRDSNIAYYCICDEMVCDNEIALCDYRLGDESFVPTLLANDISNRYSIPNDPKYWETCFFVCKSIERNNRNEILYIERLQINSVWRNYIEYLILKIKPVQSTAVLFVEWI
ncbi:hypothetical protein FACS189447_07840 [Spirochaetia bacterium]|nr:hypothetical protein FACS189447_07840 [Spirochaetia bacterium]